MHVHEEFSKILERVALYGEDFSVTRTRFQVFRGYKKSTKRREESGIDTTDLSRCDYRIGDGNNYYLNDSSYLETNFAVTW